MPYIEPFRGLRYNPDRISFISRVVAPPYDVIDDDQREELLERDPRNVVRVILDEPPEGGREQAQFEQAAQTLARWQENQVLIRDSEPSIYICEQEFNGEHGRVRRVGFIARLLLEDLGENHVFPHEQTMDEPKDDRVKLLRATRTDLSQVFAIYADEKGRINSLVREMRPELPLYEYRNERDIATIVSRVDDPEEIQCLKDMLKEQALCIADGHHRYETALAYRDEVRPDGAPHGSVPEDYTTVLFVSVADEGLTTFPTHRLVRVSEGFEKREFVNWLQREFKVRAAKVEEPEECAKAWERLRDQGAMVGCYVAPRTLYGLFPNGENAAGEKDVLPVSILTEKVLKGYLDLEPQRGAENGRIEYKSELEPIYWAVESGRYDLGFFLPPIDPAVVQKEAASGGRLPPKSTYFYPKVPSGLVMYPFEE